jgi:hypothetical protein
VLIAQLCAALMVFVVQQAATEGGNAISCLAISNRDDVTTNTNISGDVKSAAVGEV